jgi:hypothetical protein
MLRRLADLTYQRYIADRIFIQGTPDQVAGGTARFQRSESIFPDRGVEEVAIRSEYPRTGWSEAVLTAAVHKYGLEFPITDEARRRNQIDMVERGMRKLANAMVQFVDTQAITLLTTDAAVQTQAASGDWTTAATDIIGDLVTAKQAVRDVNLGYIADTLILNPAQERDILLDADIRAALPRERMGGVSNLIPGGLMDQQGQGAAVVAGVPLLGFDNVYVTPTVPAGTVLVGMSKMVGTIADEQPEGTEGYMSYDPGAGQSRIYMKMYREENTDETIVRCARFPAMWLAEPKAFVKITGA